MLIRAMSVNEENTFAATLESQGLYGRSLWASISTEKNPLHSDRLD